MIHPRALELYGTLGPRAQGMLRRGVKRLAIVNARGGFDPPRSPRAIRALPERRTRCYLVPAARHVAACDVIDRSRTVVVLTIVAVRDLDAELQRWRFGIAPSQSAMRSSER